ncbi:MAG TPA: hypothetical protein VK895_09975, partial [Jiangellaceae bacterium]|nr:hypothetical protein [Jiangellaceae bacterium]
MRTERTSSPFRWPTLPVRSTLAVDRLMGRRGMRMGAARGVGAAILALWLSLPAVANADEPFS